MEVNNNKIYAYIDNNELKMEEIMKNYTNYIYTIIRNYHTNLSNEDIEEITLDVFLTLWKNQAKLDVNRSMSSYIGGITKNLIKYKSGQEKKELNIDDIGINKKIDNDYLSVVIENIASDSAYIIVEYDIILKDKAIEKVRKHEEENENECEIGIANRIWVNEEYSLAFEEMEKISDTEYKLSQVINRMNFDDEKIHLKIWLDNFYIGHYIENCGVKLNKMLEMDIYEVSLKYN